MRLVRRSVLLAAVFAVTVFVSAAPNVTMVGFGGTVLVGDGEIFSAEAANQFRPGMVYVFRKSGGSWQQAAVLTAPTAAVLDQFGASLAREGNTLFVGAGLSTVHVFTKQGLDWKHSGTVASSAVPGATPETPVNFGTAVAATGEWLLVGKQVVGAGRGRGGRGAADATAPPVPAGAVFAFRRGADGQYTYHSTIAAADANNAADEFGASIAVEGPIVLIGATGRTNRTGIVHEFAFAENAWVSQRTFAPIGATANDAFGTRIALSGAQVVVTAPGDAGGYGAAYVYRRIAQGGRGRAGGGAPPAAAGAPATPPPAAPVSGNFTWQEVARLASPTGVRLDRFGAALAADNKEVWVGAPGAAGAGRVFVFNGNEAGFKIDGLQVVGPGLTEPASAGQSLSMRGDLAAVGAAAARHNGGALFIYERDTTGKWTEQPMLTTPIDEIAPITGAEKRCSGDGKVDIFECGSADLQAFLPPSSLTHDGHYIEMSGIWGWTDDQTKKEWALIARRDGMSFVDISTPTRPRVVADLPLTDGARPNSWREAKVYKNHAYVVADAAGQHGMQIFDLTRLRTMAPQANGRPQKIAADLIYKEIASAHNIVINEESGFAYSVGSSGGGTTCGGGLHMIDIREPKKPVFLGCYADAGTGRAGTGYSHDAQCVNYKGPDKRYRGKEICIGSNETAISLADVTDKKAPKAISRATYPTTGYTHQGWLTEDHRFFFLNDELDEGRLSENKTRTLVFDFTDLENPKLLKEHMGTEAASDHNLYIKGNLMYQANYRAGLRILNVSDPANPKEVAFFDTAPHTNNGPGFNGAWSVYPYYRSGTIVVSSIEQGLFIVKASDR